MSKVIIEKKRYNVRTPYNYDFKEIVGEINTKPSKAEPDRSMTIQEIMKRYASGLPVSGEKVPFYDDDLVVNIAKLDLSEIEALKRENSVRIAELKKQHENEQKKRNEDYKNKIAAMEQQRFEQNLKNFNEKSKKSCDSTNEA